MNPHPARCFLLVLLAGLGWLGSGWTALAERCAVCGQEIMGEKVYLLTDKVTHERQHVCDSCSRLATECFVCGMPVRTGYTELSDGRLLCARDAKEAVLDPEEARRICKEAEDELDRLFSRFTGFPTNLDIRIVDRVNLLALFKVPGNDFECPNVLGYFQPRTNHNHLRYQISIMSALTPAELKATCAHEFSHAWVHENVPVERRETLSEDAQEGFCELVSYLLVESQDEEREQEAILKNTYTRGQVQVFLQAQRQFGFNDVLDWMKYGVDAELDAGNVGAVRNVKLPGLAGMASVNSGLYAKAPSSCPDILVLKGISWSKSQPLALINDQSLGVGEFGKVRVGKTNLTIRCLAIGQSSARIKIASSGQELELSLSK